MEGMQWSYAQNFGSQMVALDLFQSVAVLSTIVVLVFHLHLCCVTESLEHWL